MDKERLLYLSHQDVEAVGLSVAEIIEGLGAAFREKGDGRVEMPPKPGIHPGSEDNFIHAMPASIPALESAGLKWVSGFPGNTQLGLPYIAGLLILNDFDTGLPLAVMDCSWITAMRTGAATALAAKFLARPDSSTAGFLACGVQARSNLEALKILYPITNVRAFDIDISAAQRFAAEMHDRLEIEIEVVERAQDAVTGCDLIVTSGPILKTPHATILEGWMDEGAFASLVDFDSFWHPDAMRQADKVCTDDLDQFMYYKDIGYFQGVPEVHADLGQLATGEKPGRESATERTMAVNLGLAMSDMAVAPLIYRRALEQGIGTWLPR